MNKKEMVLPELIERRVKDTRFTTRASEGEDGKRIIDGRAVIFDRLTDLGFCGEIIEPGALDNTDLTDVRFLINHDLSMIPLARSRKNNKNSTMQLNPNTEGLDITASVDVENNNNARSLCSAIDRGDLTGMSFMFSVRGFEWTDLDTDYPIRHITDIESIIEVSAVTLPAYEDTSISARSEEFKLESLKRELENERAKRAKDIEAVETGKSKLDVEVRMLNRLYH